MQTKEYFYSSYFYKISKQIFFTDEELPFINSFTGKALQKMYYPYVSEVCLLFSVILFWYEGVVANYIPFLTNGLLASGLLVVGFLFAKKENIGFSKVHFWYLGFLIMSLVSALFAVSRGVEGSLLLSGWMLFLQFSLAVLIAQSMAKKDKILKGLSFLSAPLALVGIYQFIFHVKTSSLWVSYFEKGIDTRAFAFFGSPNILGILLAVMAIITLGLYLKERKIYYLFITIVDVIAVGFTFSRSAWLGLVMGLLFILVAYKKRLILWSPVPLLLLLVPQVRDRIAIVFSPSYINDSSLDGRVWSFINGMHLFKKYPILGPGPGSYGGQLANGNASPVYLQSIQQGYTALYFTDNQYLEILVQTGLLGAITFFGFIVSVFVALIDKFRRKRDILVLAASGSFICFLVSGMFANVLEFGAVAVPMGIILGSALSEK